jgi:hypothetical protein
MNQPMALGNILRQICERNNLEFIRDWTGEGGNSRWITLFNSNPRLVNKLHTLMYEVEKKTQNLKHVSDILIEHWQKKMLLRRVLDSLLKIEVMPLVSQIIARMSTGVPFEYTLLDLPPFN